MATGILPVILNRQVGSLSYHSALPSDPIRYGYKTFENCYRRATEFPVPPGLPQIPALVPPLTGRGREGAGAATERLAEKLLAPCENGYFSCKYSVFRGQGLSLWGRLSSLPPEMPITAGWKACPTLYDPVAPGSHSPHD